jgi:chromosome segregation ATPase
LIRCDELKTQVRALELDLNAQKNKNEEMNRQMAAMRIEAEERKRAMEVMKSDNEKLANELKAAAAS